jgi:hypothetical protein
MPQLNLQQARDLLWDFSMNIPLASATTAEKATFRSRLNLATERLLTMGKWRGTRRRVDLPVYDNHITLPRYLESCLGVRRANSCLGARMLYSVYAPFQIAMDETWTNGVVPVSETAQTFITPDAGFKIKAVSFAVGDNAFVPAVDDTDLIFPSVVGALAMALQAVQYEIASDDRKAERWASAQKILSDDREELDGKNFPIIEVAGPFGAGDVPNLTGDYYGYTGYGYMNGY